MHLVISLKTLLGQLHNNTSRRASGIADSLTQVCHSHQAVLALATMQLRFSRCIKLTKIMKNDYGKYENISHFLKLDIILHSDFDLGTQDKEVQLVC